MNRKASDFSAWPGLGEEPKWVVLTAGACPGMAGRGKIRSWIWQIRIRAKIFYVNRYGSSFLKCILLIGWSQTGKFRVFWYIRHQHPQDQLQFKTFCSSRLCAKLGIEIFHNFRQHCCQCHRYYYQHRHQQLSHQKSLTVLLGSVSTVVTIIWFFLISWDTWKLLFGSNCLKRWIFLSIVFIKENQRYWW